VIEIFKPLIKWHFLKVFFSRAWGGLVMCNQHYIVNHLTIQNVFSEFPFLDLTSGRISCHQRIMWKYLNYCYNFRKKLQKVGLRDLLLRCVLMGLHPFSCFYVGWVVSSFQGVRGFVMLCAFDQHHKANMCLCDDLLQNLCILLSKKPWVKDHVPSHVCWLPQWTHGL
jgi:hypothetical protein